MTIRHKLFILIGLSVLMVMFLLVVFWRSTSQMEACENGGRNLSKIGSDILKAIVAEKEYLRNHDPKAAHEIIRITNQASSDVSGLMESELFSAEEIKSLEKAIASFKDSFSLFHELTFQVDAVRSRIEGDINGFNNIAINIVEKVDEAAANAFAEGDMPDVNLQSLSDTTRTAIFLMNKITLSMNRDLLLNNDAEKFRKNTEQVFNSLKSIKINFKALGNRLKSDDKSYFKFIEETQKLIVGLPEYVTTLGELWPALVELETKLESYSQSVLDKATVQARVTSEKADEVRANSILAGFIGVFIVVVVMIIGGGLIIRSITYAIGLVMKSLASQADQISAVSGQVSTTSQSLAEGASEQAATLGETSSSMEQMSSQTKQNAENAGMADNTMNEAIKVASQASESMSKMTSSMDEISTAGKEISNIIRTIDEVAFQTNLLALNAAVEAARAGEAGAGFAVVADEVRNLAQKTAEAAKNTSNIVENMIAKIKNGNQLVREADQAFNQLTTSANQAAKLMGMINLASSEQAQGIDQVNVAVAQMDQVTQKNAANAEESASLSEQLNSQAESLLEMVDSLIALVGGNGQSNMNKLKTLSDPDHGGDQQI